MKIKPLHIIATAAIFTIATTACKQKERSLQGTEKTIVFKKQGSLNIYKGDSVLVQDLAIEVAKTEYERETGLMYRTSMRDEQGMLFIFDDEQPRYFYMKNTLIPLDIIYISKDKKVVSIAENARPLDESDLPSGEPAKYVLEINGGLSARLNITKGDSISFKLQ